MNSETSINEYENNRYIFLLYSNKNAIVMDLQRILVRHHNMPIISINNEDFTQFLTPCNKQQLINNVENIQNATENIEHSILTLLIINNNFVNSVAAIKLLKIAKRMKKPMISLMIEEIENDELKELIETSEIENFELYRERLYSTGYDQCMWMSNCFKSLLSTLKFYLNSNLVINIIIIHLSKHLIYFVHFLRMKKLVIIVI